MVGFAEIAALYIGQLSFEAQLLVSDMPKRGV